MLKRKSVLFLITLLLFVSAEASQIFKCKDSRGKVTFQDSACTGTQASTGIPRASKKSTPRYNKCKLEGLPDSFNVFAVGKYSGISKADIQLGTSGNEVKEIEVVVTSDEKPVVLSLMAYDPVLWKIKRSPMSNIVAVVVGGYHTQAVVGIEKETPIKYFTYEDKTNCGSFYAYKANSQLTSASKRLKRITGKEIDRLFTSVEDQKIYVGSKRIPSYSLVYSDDYKVEDFIVKNLPPSGQKGIESLVREGKLKLATKEDRERWVAKASEKYAKFNSDLKVRTTMRHDRTYLVLQPVVLPDGLYGGHLAHFIIPEGIPMPSGPRGHSSFYFMKNGQCKGSSCPR